MLKISHSSSKGSISLAQRSAFLCCFSVSAFLSLLLTSVFRLRAVISPRESSPCYDLAGSCIKELGDSCKHHPKNGGFLPLNTQHYGYFMPCGSAASVKSSGKATARLWFVLSCVIPAKRSLPTAAPSIIIPYPALLPFLPSGLRADRLTSSCLKSPSPCLFVLPVSTSGIVLIILGSESEPQTGLWWQQ